MKVWYSHVGGVGEWVVSGNKELTEEGIFVVFCLCMVVRLGYSLG